MRPTRCAMLLAVGLLVSGSASCQFNSGGGGATSGGSVAASGGGLLAGAGIAGLFVAGAVYCMVETEDCFPDREALRAARAAQAKADADFLAGLHRYLSGDPAGLDLVCAAARQGDPRAQQFYGAELLKRAPGRRGEALAWLRLAAAQGNRTADLLLRRNADQTVPAEPAPIAPQLQENVPAVGSCGLPGDDAQDG